MATCTNPEQLTAGSSPYLCVLPDGEFLTLGLLECIDRNPELTVSHTRRWALVKFLWGACRQRQRRSTFCHPLLSVLAACLPFFSLLLAAFALGTSLLQLQHSLDACLLLPRGSLASPGHTANHPTRREQKTSEELPKQMCLVGSNAWQFFPCSQEDTGQEISDKCVFQTTGSPGWPFSLQ